MISRKTTSVPLKSPAATAAVVNDENSQKQMATVRINSTENLLVQPRRNESEPLSKYGLERTGSQDQLGRQATRSKTTVGKSPVKRSASER